MSDTTFLLGPLLEEVSRSFYLTLRILPREVRNQIGLAYLLARTTDTIADTGIVPLDERLLSLRHLKQRILGESAESLDFGGIARQQQESSERVLLERCEEAVAVLNQFDTTDRQLIRQVISTITSGQELDLTRFHGASALDIRALESEPEFDDYTYRVAGCVGEFWTKICRRHLFPRDSIDEDRLLKNGILFGKGLQRVNILRDIPADLRGGRCYLPASELAKIGLSPADLLESRNLARLRPLYNRYLDVTESFLRAGWEYTNSLPARCLRVRLACAWPVLIGMKTVARLRQGNVLDANSRIKVSRSEIKYLIAKSVLVYPFAPLWRRQFPGSR